MKHLNIFLLLVGAMILSLTSLNAQVRNCGTMEVYETQIQNDHRMQERMQMIEAQTQEYIRKNPSSRVNGVITIPVVVHVIYNTSAENVSNAQIQSQIDVLNEDFRRTNADQTNTPSQYASIAADTEIEFCLASVDPSGSATSGITRTSTTRTSFGTNDQMKFTSSGGHDAWPASDYMNMWVCDISGGILGYAQFPGGSAATDGIVIDYQYFGRGGSASSPFDLGRTATHEVGHWLNLRHIWGDGGCSIDDFVSDTPASDGANYGCAAGHTSCSTRDMVENYMDYSDDACMNIYTFGQKLRMRALFDTGGDKESLLSSNGCGQGTAPTCSDGIQNQGETGIDCGGPCPNACPPSYCDSDGQDANYEHIANVTLNTINNTTGSNGGYGDFTNLSTDLEQGQSYNISLTPDFPGTIYDEYWMVWIDYNQDYVFDANELAFDAGSLSSTTVTGSISIDANAPLGATRMRVQMKWDAAPTGPCESFSYGEVEDYMVNITSGTPPPPVCGPPTNIVISNIRADKVRIDWDAVTDAIKYQVRYRPQGTSTWSKKGTKKTGRNIPQLTAGTTYEYQMRTRCPSGWTGYTATDVFTTSANREIGNTLPVETATISLELYPNPASDHLTIAYDTYSPEGVTLRIFNMQGKQVHIEALENEGDELDVNISHLSSGLYFVQIDNGSERVSKKLMKK